MAEVLYLGYPRKRYVRTGDDFEETEVLRAKIKLLEATIIDLEKEIFWLMSLDGEGFNREISIKTIAEMVCARTGFDIADLRSGRRNFKLSTARHIFIYLARNHTKMTLMKIGRFIQKDHTSVVHGIRRIEARIKQEEDLKTLIDEISSDIRKLAS